MIDEESRLNLEADRPAVEEFLREYSGKLHPSAADAAQIDGIFWVELHPRTVPTELYVARIAWTRYLQEPASVKFADGVGGSLTVKSAWPLVPGYRPDAFDICQPFTAEGYVAHPEWRTDIHAWPQTGNPFLWVVSRLQDDLNHRYQGRAQ
jgi:hypothetical protein